MSSQHEQQASHREVRDRCNPNNPSLSGNQDRRDALLSFVAAGVFAVSFLRNIFSTKKELSLEEAVHLRFSRMIRDELDSVLRDKAYSQQDVEWIRHKGWREICPSVLSKHMTQMRSGDCGSEEVRDTVRQMLRQEIQEVLQRRREYMKRPLDPEVKRWKEKMRQHLPLA